MILISDKKKWRLCKLIATTKYIAEITAWERNREVQIENMEKIAKNLGDIAYEIGGERFAKVDVVSCEDELFKEEQKT